MAISGSGEDVVVSAVVKAILCCVVSILGVESSFFISDTVAATGAGDLNSFDAVVSAVVTTVATAVTIFVFTVTADFVIVALVTASTCFEEVVVAGYFSPCSVSYNSSMVSHETDLAVSTSQIKTNMFAGFLS